VGQAVTGYGLVLFAVFAAYFRPVRLFVAELVILVSAWGIGLTLNPRPLSAIYFLVAVGVITTTSVMVAALAQRLQQQACYDSLTGALNRRGLDLMAPQTQALATRAGVPVTVGLIDLNEFKTHNDQFGHAAGDRLLIQVSAAWHAQMRRTDLMARYGGDEFAVILPGSTEETAAEIEGRAHEGVDASWCVGFTRWGPDEDLDAALARADRELYRAKAERKRSAY
jgi:diguanylate cyclase (GGDEF)-like protein